MDASLKKILKSVTLELRHLLEGRYDAEGKWKPGDLEERLAAIGVRRDKESVPLDELDYLSSEDKHARKVVDAYIQLREEADVSRTEAVAEFVRETAYTWANRLLALRCMESRDLIDEVILKKGVYGGRSLEHHRLAQRQPELCAGEDDGLFAVLDNVFEKQAKRLPMLFDPQAPGVALRPSAAKLRTCIELLSLQPEALRKAGVRLGEADSQSSGDGDSQPTTSDVFKAPDALGWAYQFWNTEEKQRVFDSLNADKEAKIVGADIVPATQLYTESYMVQFLVQNSLGATWMGMHPDSRLFEKWEYYVRDADQVSITKKPIRELTFLDPACGSGHFLLEAFDLFYAMYEEEGELTEPEDICDAILNKNLYGIDIDARSIQIAEAALWMKAAERAFDYEGVPTNLIAAVSSHLKGPHWEEFLASFEKEPSVARVLRKFGESMEHIDELGSLARPNEDLKKIIAEEHAAWEQQVREEKESNFLFPEMQKDANTGKLPFNEISDEEFGDRLFYRAKAALDLFTTQAKHRGDFQDQFLGTEAKTGFLLLNLLGRRYDIVAANPPYLTVYSMGDYPRQWLSEKYPRSYYDLYAAFMEQAIALSQPNNGRIAFVAQSSFLTIRNYTELRSLLLEQASPFVVADLGTGAFAEITGAKVNVLLYVSNTRCADCAAFLDLRRVSDKRMALITTPTELISKVRPSTFAEIPRTPFIYRLPANLKRLLTSSDTVLTHGQAYLGLKTAANARYVRMATEVPATSGRWKRLVSETNSFPYYKEVTAAVSFRDCDIGYYRSHKSAQIYNETLWDRPGLTFGAAAGRGFDVKLLEPETMVLNSSNLILLDDPFECVAVAGVFNSALYRTLMNLLNPTINNTPGDVHRLPWPRNALAHQRDLEQHAVVIIDSLKKVRESIVASVTFEFPSKRGSLSDVARSLFCERIESDRKLIYAKAAIERIVAQSLLDDVSQVEFVLEWVGIHPCHIVAGGLAEGREITARPIDADCLLEQIAIEERMSPDALSPDVIPVDVKASEDNSTVRQLFEAIVMWVCGYEWPREQDRLRPIPRSATGVTPLTPGAPEAPLIEQVYDASAALFSTEEGIADWHHDFRTIAGTSVERWLWTEFFSDHSSRFEKRPVVWQIQSAPYSERRPPVFGCMVQVQQVSTNTMFDVVKRVEDVKNACETEMRGLESLAHEARSDRQEQRRLYLEDATTELRQFLEQLNGLLLRGFSDGSVDSALVQLAINDASLSLKAAWLRRLSALLGDTVLPSWKQVAKDFAIHHEFHGWVLEALSHLNHHCAAVGVKPPKIKDVGDEPTSAELAMLICDEAEQMMKDSLKCACDAWWKQFDDIVLGPLKEQVKEMKAERAEIKETLEFDPAPEADEVMVLKLRDKQLREDLKPIEKKIKTLKAKATKLRDEIEAWSSDEPLTWESWLAEQPLFDKVASIDGKKAPPKSIAEFVAQESAYIPDLNDGVRVNIAPLQKAGILAADVLAAKDVDKAIADRAEWRADERRWVREGKLPQPGWWPVKEGE